MIFGSLRRSFISMERREDPLKLFDLVKAGFRWLSVTSESFLLSNLVRKIFPMIVVGAFFSQFLLLTVLCLGAPFL